MNRSKIEWCDHTWNPVTGCRHGCQYCYARRLTKRFCGNVRLNLMAKDDYRVEYDADGREEIYVLDKPMLNETGNQLVYPFGFEPTLHRYRMDIPSKLKMGNNIFVGAMCDLFGEWVPDEWLDEVFEACEKNPIHNYLFLTKNVSRYSHYGVPTEGKKNMWYGTTITRESEVSRFNSLPAFGNTFVSIEPLLEDIEPEKHNILFKQVDWIILGAETGVQKNKTVPEFEWIKKIVVEADYAGVPVFMKDSLVKVVGEDNMRREFPKQLQHSEISPKLKKKLFDDCVECHKHLKKSEMITLLGRSRRGEQPKQYAFMCRKCFSDFCKNHNIEEPNFKIMEEETDGENDD
ncbi:MAG: DUF5131 family protein [Hespellia sp.]|nr:DUF5131 family protein [Hespellia sp.]